MKRLQFVNDYIYHIYNRGVEKRKIFLDNKDYLRFIQNLFDMNDQDHSKNSLFYVSSVENIYQKPNKKANGNIFKQKPRKLLVEILSYVLMPNHFHLLLKQVQEGGIIKFMQKLGTAYAMYFNEKYKRVGSLFQGRYKAVLVDKESYFIHLPFYIHTNPVELCRFNNTKEQMAFLRNYRWSSYLDYIGIENFPSLLNQELILSYFNNYKNYEKETENWLKDWRMNITAISDYTIEKPHFSDYQIKKTKQSQRYE